MTFSVLDGVSGAADGDPTGQLLYGFEFNPALTVSGASMSEDILISYYVVAPTDELTSLHIALTGSGITTGSTTVTEGDCGFLRERRTKAPGEANRRLHVVQPGTHRESTNGTTRGLSHGRWPIWRFCCLEGY